MYKSYKKLFITLLFTGLSSQAFAETAVQSIKSSKLTDSIYVLTGKGGNIGASIGSDGTFLIDDKFAPLTEDILKQLKAIGGDTPKFVINTHFHHDHTGGNENLGKKGSIIVAHENVYKRLSTGSFIETFNKKIEPSSKDALPEITFTKDITFHLNNDEVQVFHLANAHTDGDSVIHFKKANVIHMGDTMFNGFYPFIDPQHGGTLQGALAAINTVLERVDDKTIIIPGHGPVANKSDLIRYRDMLKFAYDQLQPLKASGKTLTQALAEKPLQKLDADWSNGIFKTERWIRLVYKGIK